MIGNVLRLASALVVVVSNGGSLRFPVLGLLLFSLDVPCNGSTREVVLIAAWPHLLDEL